MIGRTATEKTPLTRGLFFGPETPWWAGLLLVGLCALPFLPGLSGPFQLDDLTNLERIRVGDFSWSALYNAAFSNTSGPLGRPLSNLTFVANQLAGGYDPFGYKVVNLVLHVACGAAILLTATLILPLLAPGMTASRRNGVAVATACLWTIHPFQVSTALYVVQRMSQLSALLMLAAICVALRGVSRPGALPRVRDGIALTAAVGIVSILAVLSKENGILVPFLLLAVRLSLPDQPAGLATDSTGKRMFWWSAAYAPVVLAIVAAAAWWKDIVGGYQLRDFTLAERLLTEPLILAGYLKSFFVPDLRDMGLFLDGIPMASASDPLAWLAAIALVAIVSGAFLLRRRLPLLAFAVFWFLGAHLLESTFLPLEPAFEHRNYLALFGVALFAVASVARLFDVIRPQLAGIVVAACFVVLGLMTFMRASAWSEHQRFIISEARHHPQSLRAQVELAAIESAAGDNAAAAQRIEALQTAYPDLFFPAAMDMDVACAVPGHVVDWARIRTLVAARPRDLNVTSYHKAIALKIDRGLCLGGIAEAFDAHLRELVAIYREAGLPAEAQFLLMMRADLQDDPGATRELLHAAVRTAPYNDAALYRLAYFELNAGDADAAARAIDQLARRTAWWDPDAHRIRELQGYLADLRGEQDRHGSAEGG